MRVRVFGVRGGVGPLTDPAVKAAALQAFREDFYLDPDARVSGMRREGDEAVIRYTDTAGREVTERFDYVLAATGRAPNVRGLGTENTGLALDARGVPVFDAATCNAAARRSSAGDVNDDAAAAARGRRRRQGGRRERRCLARAQAAGTPRAHGGGVFRSADRHGGPALRRPRGSFVTGEVSFEDRGAAASC